MNKKHVLVIAAAVLAGYMLQNYIAKIPVVNKLPVLG